MKNKRVIVISGTRPTKPNVSIREIYNKWRSIDHLIPKINEIENAFCLFVWIFLFLSFFLNNNYVHYTKALGIQEIIYNL